MDRFYLMRFPLIFCKQRVLALVLLVCAYGAVWGQKSFNLEISGLEAHEKLVAELNPPNQTYPDSATVYFTLQKILTNLQSAGFLESHVERIGMKDSTFQIKYNSGKQYTWASLSNGNVDPSWLTFSGFRSRLYEKKPFHYSEIKAMMEEILSQAENRGYPFANIWLDSLVIDEAQIEAKLMMEKGRLVFFEGVNVIGNAKISKVYLENYLGVKKGELFNKATLLKIKNRIRELPFLIEKRASSVTFKGSKATVNIFVDKKRSSRWDFLIGILPQTPTQEGEPARPIVTASVLGDLYNQFARGERIYFSFEQLRPQRQELNLAFTYPYVLDLPFGLDLSFDMYRRDTAFTDVISDFGIQYLFEGNNYLKVFWNNRSSFVQNVDTQFIIRNERLPDVQDVRNSSFGLEYYFQKLDYRFNPRKGWALKARGGAGFKRIKENNTILQIRSGDFIGQRLYDTLDNRTFQFRLSTNLETFVPITANSTFKIGLNAAYIFAQKPVLQNEQYRIGGNRLLRGFNEEAINATLYSVLTLEYRLLISTNSYLYAFSDLAYIEDITLEKRRFDRPMSFGAGITFETAVGLFGFSLAVGRQLQNPIDFRNPKIHFGYVSFF